MCSGLSACEWPAKKNQLLHTLKSYKHLTDAWVKIGDLPPKKCPGIFPAHVMGFLSFLSFLRSLGLKLGFKRWSLDPSPRSQLCYASWSSPDLMGSVSECYPWTMLNHEGKPRLAICASCPEASLIKSAKRPELIWKSPGLWGDVTRLCEVNSFRNHFWWYPIAAPGH